MRKLILFVPLLLLLLPLGVNAQGIDPWKNRAVISVMDGDTVVLDNGEVIHLIGLLSPHARHAKKEAEPFGDQARALTEEMLLGQQVEISFDKAYGLNGHRDKDGRAMAYLTITRGAEKAIANQELLKEGAAFLAPIPEDLQIADVLKSAEAEARKHKTGVWTTTDKSPIEVAAAAGKTFEEPPPTLTLIYIRPIAPILQGPGVTPNTVAVNRTPTPTSSKKASIDMEDLRKTEPVSITKPKETKEADPDLNLYKLSSHQAFYSLLDNDQRLELYKATTIDNESDYRISIKQGGKDVVMITNYEGLKNFERLLNKGTESQPTLTSVETSVGSLNGSHGAITVSTGKDGGLVLSLTGKDGNARMYLNRQNALKIQIAIGAQ